MTVWSTIHRLRNDYPQEDTYGEIGETHTVPGGEAANAALLLAHWGHDVVLDGCHTGEATREHLLEFFGRTRVDISLMTHEAGFSGWQDIVLCAGKSRTVLGWFGQFLTDGRSHWTSPSRKKVEWADCVVLDPFFPGTSEKLAEMCVQAKTDFVTVDCRWENAIAKTARAIVDSNEFLDQQYPGQSDEAVIEAYATTCRGLVVFTRGEQPVLARSGDNDTKQIPVLTIEPVDTLAAGDSFRAGLVHGLLAENSDLEATQLATLTAAAVCQRFPSIHPVPSLEEIRSLGRSVAE